MARALTVEQAAEFLQVSPYTVRQWLRTGKIPGRKIGRVYRILDTDLEALFGADRSQTAGAVREKAALECLPRTAKQRSVRELLECKREEILRIARTHGASNVRIFGSVARGEADENSDVDFLVEFEPGTSLLQHCALIADLEDLLGRKVDVAPEKTLKERVRDQVLAEAVPL